MSQPVKVRTMRELPDQDTLKRLLDYDPATGILTWKARVPADFKGDRQLRDCGVWNRRFAGTPALTALVHGYRHGHINRIKYRAHRVIWKWMTGEEPNEVDHANGARCDNRWGNLRSVTRVINGRNVGLGKANTSGIIGVFWAKARNKWYARAELNGKSRHIGSYDSKQDAHAARIAALAGEGFTDRHLCAGGAK